MLSVPVHQGQKSPSGGPDATLDRSTVADIVWVTDNPRAPLLRDRAAPIRGAVAHHNHLRALETQATNLIQQRSQVLGLIEHRNNNRDVAAVTHRSGRRNIP